MRGFLGGLILGGILVAIGAAVLSLLNPLPQRPDVAAESPQAVIEKNPDNDPSGMATAGRDADLVEAAPIAPGADATSPDDLSSIDKADTAPADKPEVGQATGGLQGPDETAESTGVEVKTDAPVAPTSSSRAPEVPQGETDLKVSTDQPTQPIVPDTSESGPGFGSSGPPTPQTGASPDVITRADPERTPAQPTAPVSTPDAETAPVASTQPVTQPLAPSTQQSDPAVLPVTQAEPETEEKSAETSPTPEVETAAPPTPQATPGPETAPVPETATSEPKIAALPQAGDENAGARTTIGKKVTPLTERGKPVPELQTSPAVAPIKAFATPFENSEDKPLMSIVLIDDSESIGAEALQEFPYPLTFAVDPSAPDAAEKMARHRAAGFEVVVLANMPATATAQDAEVTLAVWLDALPETVAVLEGTRSGIQGNRDLSDQVAAIVISTGHGLIMQDNGLNTAQKLAARAGVPAAVVFRDFDGAGQTPTVMRRFLDQAAFRAGQEGAVIMLGRVRPDTISALLLWGLQDRAARVALAPISAALTQNQD